MLGQASLFREAGAHHLHGDEGERNQGKGEVKGRIFFVSLMFVLVSGFMGCSRARVPPPVSFPPPVERKEPPPYEVDGKIYYPLGKVEDYQESGIASWYGDEFHGKRTSSGETYNMYASTAAHRILPFGTYVEVKNLMNGERTTVRINDRGPFKKDRIIDLSYTGAREIGLIGPGTVPVELKVVGMSSSSSLYWTGCFTVQVGAFEDRKNAVRLKEKLSPYYAPVYITDFDSPEGVIYRVRVGKYHTLEETVKIQEGLASRGYQDTFVVAEQ